MTDDRQQLLAYYCTQCRTDFAAYTHNPKACPNCGVTFGGGDDNDDG